jgi:hypothetical protein
MMSPRWDPESLSSVDVSSASPSATLLPSRASIDSNYKKSKMLDWTWTLSEIDVIQCLLVVLSCLFSIASNALFLIQHTNESWGSLGTILVKSVGTRVFEITSLVSMCWCCFFVAKTHKTVNGIRDLNDQKSLEMETVSASQPQQVKPRSLSSPCFPSPEVTKNRRGSGKSLPASFKESTHQQKRSNRVKKCEPKI